MSTKDAASSSPATSNSATKPSPTTGTKPHRLPAPTLFVGPPSRTASQLSVSRQGIDSGKDPLTRQRPNKLGRSTTADTPDAKDGSSSNNNNSPTTNALPTLRKASEREADARWREMQSTLNEVELTAQSSTHVFGTQHAAALDDLRRAQVALAHAWGRGNEEKAVRAAEDERAQEASVERFGNADEIARDRREAGEGGGRRRGDTGVSVSTTLSDESVLSDGTAGGGGGGGEAGTGRSQLEDETAQDIKLASERRAANEAYFKKVEEGVKDVVAKLEVVAEAMRGVEGESRSLWGGTASERSSGSERDSRQTRGGKAQAAGG
ncbi:hypothetical protein LTR91_004689 [Friedmanniomyces endolithicus]|uniref:Uncharacterized protein n=1 Tax=Friedmanniomyces endolithicus TaxID=329885 RepID=A0A4U0UJY2_9PEZI|nr:hypothetical protein LTS09_016157 [Friedmanniomyces endolithicus]KAK0267046.1 hypothetical protein LTR35_016623 [Friedmanniomyces endolithicus]KAK0273617.1 hypothetical protein LTS00_015740 [Friedmanniomyces endolithicus]KAK0305948.1 hypothetical protein LTR82_016590 [Friedmanniomyces endolithicus]KAK0315340.1 hypothetical protein LTR01_000637 [Friedmanniomyces endolithicus]